MKWFTVLFPFLLICFFAFPTFSQIEISGKVSDTSGKPLESINVLVYPKHSGVLTAFGFTDEDGKFKISAELDTDSLDIQLSSINYEKVNFTLPNKTQKIDFVLKQDVKLLETITVRAKPIELRGDTLSYLVEQFKGKDDKSIEDVLKKMPGIEIEPSGKILYQGMPINKFYVEGLDLTDGRYSMISSNLPYNSVSVVEVFEKHQPIRILEDRVYSPQAALNIKLKKDVALTGSGKAATGFSPWLWDVNLTPMLLSSRIQLLASYQTNNTGNDVSRQLQQLTSTDEKRFPYKPRNNIQLFDAGSVNQYGAIDQERFLDNTIQLVNFNALIPLKKDLQLRADIYFVDDRRENESAAEYLYMLPDGTLQVNEAYQRNRKNTYWQGSFDLKRNTKGNYLKNKTQFKVNKDTYQDLILNSGDTINQNVSMPFNQLSNRLNTIFSAGKSIIEIQSVVEYDNGPQNLTVFPFPHNLQSDSSQTYPQANQDASLERLFLDQYAGSNFSWKRWVFSLRVGFALRFQQLNTQLLIAQPDSIADTSGLIFNNQLKSEQYQFYLIPAIQYKFKKLRFIFDWPINQQQLSFTDEENNATLSESKLLNAPKLSMYYAFGGFWDLQLSWHYLQRLSDPDDFYYNYMLKNYRKLIKTDALIQQTNQNIASVSILYRNAITAFFNTLTYYFVQRQSNLMYSNLLQDDGSIVVVAYEIPNSGLSHNLSLRSSKFISAIKSSISLKIGFMTYGGQSLVNKELFDSKTSQFNIAPEIYFQATSWMNLNYKFLYNVVNSKIEDELRSQIKMNKHYFSLNLFPADNQMFNLNFEYYVYNQTHYNFVDLMYRYSIRNTKFDLELRWNNILNSKTFIEQQYSQYMVAEYEQVLRPSQVLVGVKFSF